MSSGSGLVLHQFLQSHFNEKARWGLDWKGAPHRRVSHLPGPHASKIRKLSGQTAVPVLVDDGEVVAGSARILAHVDARFPERPLLPESPEARRRALEIQRHFDEEVGPAARAALFSVMLDEPDFVVAIFAGRASLPMRLFYRRLFPVAKGKIVRAYGLDDPASVERTFDVVGQAFDFVAKESERSGYLVGDDFSIADLTAASLLCVVLDPEHPDMRRPRPIPQRVQAFIARWEGHPGAQWVSEQYRRHRPTSCELP